MGQTPERRPSWRQDRQGSAASRGYDAKWRRARLDFLAAHPLCERCSKEGKVEPATVVNHRIPHQGDQRLFWDRKNWEASCKPHHDRDIKIEETHGFSSDVGPDGLPVDPRHPFYR